MPNIQELFKTPGLWLAVAAILLNLSASPIAQAVKANDENGQDKIRLWIKIVSLALAVGGFILVAKNIFFK